MKGWSCYVGAAVAALCCAAASCAHAWLDGAKIETAVYVSSSEGSDENPGTREAPLRSFEKIPRKNAGIFLKSGDVFYGPLKGLENCAVDSYGNGAKPVVSGFKRLKNPDAWEMLPGGIWRLDMSRRENFEGHSGGEASAPGCFNNIGAIYDAASDSVRGRMVKRMEDLKDDWDFFTSAEHRLEKLGGEPFRYLYVKLGHNPSEGADLHFTPYLSGVERLRDCVVKNIAVKGFGRHGVTQASGCVFDGLDVDVIGGSIQVGYPNWVRLGNGFEFWMSGEAGGGNNNFNVVENCTVSRTFDCGATIQGMGKKLGGVRGVKFLNNRFYRCRQAFEHWLRTDEGEISVEDCEFSGNLAWEMGENEFSSPYPCDLGLLSYDDASRPIKISGNTFYGSGIYFGENWSSSIGNNTYYVFKGQGLHLSYNKKLPDIYAGGDADIAAYRLRLGDTTSTIHIVDRGDMGLRRKLLDGEFSYVKGLQKKKAAAD